MARLECQKCKTIYTEVEEMKDCILCTHKEFRKADVPIVVPKWHTYGGNIGYVVSWKSIRPPEEAVA